MLLIIRITRTQLDNYRQEILRCLKHNSSNVHISQIYVYTDDIDHKISLPKTKVIFKRKLLSDEELIVEGKRVSKFNKIIISEPTIQFQEDLYKIVDEDLKNNVFKNQDYLIFSKESKLNTRNIFELKIKQINLSVKKINIQNNLNIENNKTENKTTIIKKSIYDPTIIVPTRRRKKLDVLIVSVNYNDYLLLSLINNTKIFENITVVTTNDDLVCQEICEKFGVNCVISNRIYENNAKFNKGRAINDGIKSLIDPDMILLLDADIIIENELNLDVISDEILYTSDRIIYRDYNSYLNKTNGIEEIDKGYGFFQLFCINSKLVNKENPFTESSEAVDQPAPNNRPSGSDLIFRDSFGLNRRSINSKAIHIGDIKQNWNGRKTDQFINKSTFNKLLKDNCLTLDRPDRCEKVKEEFDKYKIDVERFSAIDGLKLSDNDFKNYNIQILSEEKSSKVFIKDFRDKNIKPKLAVITTFFNPCNYINLKHNYLKFSKKIKDKCDLFTIELSFDGNFFINDENVIHINGDKDNILWQKERLLNILLSKLPKDYTNIAWVDCDILFENENWIDEINEKLKYYKVLHLFENAKRLRSDGTIGLISKSIVKISEEKNSLEKNLSNGIPGFAWAARREVLEKIKFLDTQIIGGSDALMFFSFVGQNNTTTHSKMNEKWLSVYNKWFDKSFNEVRYSVNYISGDITHLYHGDMKNRNYNNRYEILNSHGFDPKKDLIFDKNRLWKLKDSTISEKMSNYFESRNEDDNIIDINSYFDKIFVVNLKRKRDKWRNIKSKLEKLDIKFERFNAVDGLYLKFDNSNFIQGKGMIENKFALGCLESHLEIIKIARQNNYRRILIFEDDILISEDIKILIQNLRELKSWKLLYLGSSQYDWNVEMYNDNFYLSKKSLGTFAYAVDESIYTEAIDFLENRNKSVDNILSDIQQKHHGECFTFYPNICKADVSESEIREGRDNVEHSKKMRWNILNNYI